jgi:hypothetical protein
MLTSPLRFRFDKSNHSYISAVTYALLFARHPQEVNWTKFPLQVQCSYDSPSVFPHLPIALKHCQNYCRYSKQPPRYEFLAETAVQPLQDVIAYLTKHSSISNLTDDLAQAQSVTTRPIAQGGLADVYRATMSDGTQLAVKCLRQQNNKHVKVHTFFCSEVSYPQYYL